MWTGHACGLLEPHNIEFFLGLREHKSEYIRGWAIQLDLEDGEATNLDRLVELAYKDDSQLVRLYLASALQRLPLEDRWQIAEGLVGHADDAFDQNLPLMIWYGVEPLVVADAKRALALAGASRIPLVRQYIYRRAAADPEAINALLAAMASTGDLNQQKTMLAEITAAVSKQGRLQMPAQWPDVYAKLSAIDDEQVRDQAQMITVKFGDKSIFPALRQIAANETAKTGSRSNALAALISGKDPELPPLLIDLLDDEALRGQAIRGLAGFQHDATADELLKHYASFSPSERSDAVMAMVSRATYARKLLAAVDQKLVSHQDLSAVAIRQIELLGDDQLNATVNKVWGTMRSTPAEKNGQNRGVQAEADAQSLGPSRSLQRSIGV